MNSVNSNNDARNFALGATGAVVGFESETYLRKALKKPMRCYIDKEFKNLQGGGFRPYIENAIRQNNLENDVKVVDLNETTKNAVKKLLEMETEEAPKNTSEKIGNNIAKAILYILRMNGDKEKVINQVIRGENAFFAPQQNAVVCNFEKFGAPMFHEIQHKLNSQSSNILIKALAKSRNAIAFIGAPAISLTALLTDKKDPNQKQGLNDKIKNNCGTLAFLSFLPLTAEEFIANIKGTKVAERAGVTGDMLKKVKHCHKMSMLSYGFGAISIGLAAWGGNKLRDLICANKTPTAPRQFAVNRQM